MQGLSDSDFILNSAITFSLSHPYRAFGPSNESHFLFSPHLHVQSLKQLKLKILSSKTEFYFDHPVKILFLEWENLKVRDLIPYNSFNTNA